MASLLHILNFTSFIHKLSSSSSISLAFFQKSHLPSTVVAFPFCSLSLAFSNKTHVPNSYSFLAGSSFLVQAAAQTPGTEQSQTIEELRKPDDAEEVVGEEEDESSRTRLYAQNVPWSITADDLRPLFEKYGTVEEIELAMYNKTRNRGLAFVSMTSHEEAVAALNNLASYEFEGRELKLYWAKPKKKRPSSPPPPTPAPIHNLFVANLSYKARAKDLKEFFNANDANVISAEIIFNDNPRRSSGYGFVSFKTKAEADAALSAFQGKEFLGRPLRMARSRRFRKQETKVNIQSQSASDELNHKAEELEKNAEV